MVPHLWHLVVAYELNSLRHRKKEEERKKKERRRQKFQCVFKWCLPQACVTELKIASVTLSRHPRYVGQFVTRAALVVGKYGNFL